ncbi:LmbE family protein [Alkalispirochaeta odontotermitis]|nr:LmbE family protein [Alkalispirochaeta odontotermitis]
MTETAEVMVVSPHPDDAEFGVAGTVARWVKEGKRVIYVVCTNGDKGTSDINMKPEKLVAIRKKEQRAAADILGVSDVIFLGLPDQGLEETPEFRRMLVRLIRQYRPDTVVTADPYRHYIWHRDHRITGQVTLDAVFPYARDHLAYPDLLEEGLTPHKVREVWFWAAEQVNHRSDITDTFDLKLQALRCHDSQMQEMDEPNPAGWLRERCKDIAKDEEFELGEAFHRVEISR